MLSCLTLLRCAALFDSQKLAPPACCLDDTHVVVQAADATAQAALRRDLLLSGLSPVDSQSRAAEVSSTVAVSLDSLLIDTLQWPFVSRPLAIANPAGCEPC